MSLQQDSSCSSTSMPSDTITSEILDDPYPALRLTQGPQSADSVTIAIGLTVIYRSRAPEDVPTLTFRPIFCPTATIDTDDDARSLFTKLNRLTLGITRRTASLCNPYLAKARKEWAHNASLRYKCLEGRKKERHEFEATVGNTLLKTLEREMSLPPGFSECSRPRFIYMPSKDWERLRGCPVTATWSFSENAVVKTASYTQTLQADQAGTATAVTAFPTSAYTTIDSDPGQDMSALTREPVTTAQTDIVPLTSTPVASGRVELGDEGRQAATGGRKRKKRRGH